jgi:hypothetical protein
MTGSAENCIMSSSLPKNSTMNKSKKGEMSRAFGAHWDMRNACTILAGKPEGKRPIRRSWRKWEHNAKMDRRETGMENVDWIHLVQERGRWRALEKTEIRPFLH